MWLEGYVFPEAWADLRGHAVEDERERTVLQEELRREIHSPHPLAGRALTVVGRSYANDDVLVDAGNGSLILVHLTYVDTEADPSRYPTYVVMSTQADFEARVDA